MMISRVINGSIPGGGHLVHPFDVKFFFISGFFIRMEQEYYFLIKRSNFSRFYIPDWSTLAELIPVRAMRDQDKYLFFII